VTFSRFDHECMAEALRLARKGLYTTDPNPRVGCVIADATQIVGRGWHAAAGGPHAEIAALQDAALQFAALESAALESAALESAALDSAALDSAVAAVRGKTAYVTLEPCSHHGRTPPCADALVAAGIARVVFACADPNPRVNGGGAARLRAAGVDVQSGLLAGEAAALNCGFLMRMQSGRPWVRLKSAISLDGRTALRNGESRWISSEESRRDVQHWRARSSAILTGIGTVLADDPRLEARIESAAEGGVLQPLRVVADSRWRTPPASRVLQDPARTLLAGDRDRAIPAALQALGARCLPLPAASGRVDLEALLQALAELEINEVQVEAGARLCGALLGAGLVDEWLVYQAPVLLGDGGPGLAALGPLESMTERMHLEVLETTHFGDDLRLRLKPLFTRAGC
jgi:diaminohydroxyphosphoribosylaminopyrimidine deaminase/5-amino-6-(5-phosphoribosylamino)uracil reductase